jgi:hypothetical protein
LGRIHAREKGKEHPPKRSHNNINDGNPKASAISESQRDEQPPTTHATHIERSVNSTAQMDEKGKVGVRIKTNDVKLAFREETTGYRSASKTQIQVNGVHNV